MSAFTLELITYFDDYRSRRELILPCCAHVHKRVGRWVYKPEINDIGVPVAYLENKELDSWANMQITNKTYLVPANSPRNNELRTRWDIVVGKSYSSRYKSIAATNETYVDETGKVRPLFWRHDLPTNTVEVQVEVVERGNRAIVDSGWVLKLDQDSIFTNYRNHYDPDTGSYKLYFIVATTSDGTRVQELLNPVPACKEADWEDIDQITGKLTTDYPVYTKAQGSSGWTFSFNTSSTWYIKPVEDSLIQVRKPAGKTAEDPWYLRVTDGEVSALVNEAVRRYSVPEYDYQPFAPYKPIVFNSYERLLFVNPSVICAPRGNLAIEPDEGLHLSLFISDPEGNLLKAITTDTALEAVRYSDTNVYWESDKIQSWDNHAGIISLGIELLPSWQVAASYYYRADDFEYVAVDFNPLNHPEVLQYLYVVYCIPGVNQLDRAIHHLVVDPSGVIVHTSQDQGINHPNFQLYDGIGAYNPDTVIGLKYVSDIEDDTFTTRYCAGEDNTYGYMVLAEIVVIDTALVEDQFVVDARRNGNALVPETLHDALRANPKLAQSLYGFGPDGQEIPANQVMIIKAPITLLREYGGDLEQDIAEKYLRRYMQSYGHAVIDWEYPNSVLTGWSQSAGTVTLTYTWEGPDYGYILYRRENPTEEWQFLHWEVSPAPGTIIYIDTGLESTKKYYYTIRVLEGDVEYPKGNSLCIEVR